MNFRRSPRRPYATGRLGERRQQLHPPVEVHAALARGAGLEAAVDELLGDAELLVLDELAVPAPLQKETIQGKTRSFPPPVPPPNKDPATGTLRK